ncbi:MAG: deoxyribonuclease V [bacterium]
MQYRDIHPFQVSYSEALEIQNRLKLMVETTPLGHPVRYVAGADISYSKGDNRLFAGIVVLTFPGLEKVEEVRAEGEAAFPYIPGLLSFREAPPLLAAFSRLRHEPDVTIFDGQGIAHPRRLGIAAHLGVILDRPTIGCAKSRLIGKYAGPGEHKGDRSPLQYEGETVGMVLRTRSRTKPVFVSIGNKIDLDTAVALVLACTRTYRLPEPTRQAHILANRIRVEAQGLTPRTQLL